ncbi:hypothetical protein MWL79_26155, partial [Escherichia coli]|nr:hypothetical protein [Escherichia coli]
ATPFTIMGRLSPVSLSIPVNDTEAVLEWKSIKTDRANKHFIDAMPPPISFERTLFTSHELRAHQFGSLPNFLPLIFTPFSVKERYK